MRIVYFDDQADCLTHIIPTLRRALEQNGVEARVVFHTSNWLRAMHKEDAIDDRKLWLVDVLSASLPKSELAPLREAMKAAIASDATASSLYESSKALRGRTHLGIAIAMFARSRGIPFRIVSHTAASDAAPLLSYLTTGESSVLSQRDWSFEKNLLQGEYPGEPATKAEYDRLVALVESVARGATGDACPETPSEETVKEHARREEGISQKELTGRADDGNSPQPIPTLLVGGASAARSSDPLAQVRNGSSLSPVTESTLSSEDGASTKSPGRVPLWRQSSRFLALVGGVIVSICTVIAVLSVPEVHDFFFPPQVKIEDFHVDCFSGSKSIPYRNIGKSAKYRCIVGDAVVITARLAPAGYCHVITLSPDGQVEVSCNGGAAGRISDFRFPEALLERHILNKGEGTHAFVLVAGFCQLSQSEEKEIVRSLQRVWEGVRSNKAVEYDGREFSVGDPPTRLIKICDLLVDLKKRELMDAFWVVSLPVDGKLPDGKSGEKGT